LTVTNLYGMYYKNPTALGSNISVTNCYGLYVENPTRGSSLNIGILNNGDLEQASGTEYRIGDESTDGTWKTYISTSGYLVDAKRVSGSYQDTLWNDYNIPGLTLQGGASAPDVIDLNGATYIQGYAFDGGALTESASGVVEILHGYKELTDIYPHVHWQPTTTGAGDVKWWIEYYLAYPDGTVSSVSTDSVVDSSNLTAWGGHIAEFSAISGTNITVGTQIHFAIYRDPTDAADTYTEDAVLDQFGVHVEEESQGSINRLSK